MSKHTVQRTEENHIGIRWVPCVLYFSKKQMNVQLLHTLELTLERISRRTRSTVKHFAAKTIHLYSRTGYDLPVAGIDPVIH